ncbi:MAG: four helix bundle protein [bacterium]|nr:four helix bundle protein [bacterium]
MSDNYFEKIKSKMNELAHLVYRLTVGFPKNELYGVVSQLRRSSLSVVLNYIEGYARVRDKVQANFLEISYGSLQETKYLLEFSFEEKYIKKSDYEYAIGLSDEIGAMLWTTIRMVKNRTNFV